MKCNYFAFFSYLSELKFLKEAEVLFDGNTYKLNIEEKNQIQEALEMAFWDAKERNKRKKK